MNGMTKFGLDTLTIQETQQDSTASAKVAEFEAAGRALLPKLEEADRNLSQEKANWEKLKRLALEMADTNKTKSIAVAEFKAGCIEECIANFGAVDEAGRAGQLRTRTDALTLANDAYFYLMEVVIPDGEEATLLAQLRVRQVETVTASITSLLNDARTQQKLAGVFEAEGRIAFIGGKSSELEALYHKAVIAEKSAEDALARFRAGRAKLAEQRAALGIITSRQVKNAI
jgi:hypothetical protein